MKKCGIDLGEDNDLERMLGEDGVIPMKADDERISQAKLAEYQIIRMLG